MLVFLDFEASSLAKRSYPIEVAWVFAQADGQQQREEKHLIRPATDWIDWDADAEAIHGISRDTLRREGEPLDVVAARMMEVLNGHHLVASAPSWDGKWLSALLRTAGWPRHSLRLGSTADARRARVVQILEDAKWPVSSMPEAVSAVLENEQNFRPSGTAAHRALPDARAELARWLAAGDAARAWIDER
jgi:DNA polymerase III epsilon subunit-like protein